MFPAVHAVKLWLYEPVNMDIKRSGYIVWLRLIWEVGCIHLICYFVRKQKAGSPAQHNLKEKQKAAAEVNAVDYALRQKGAFLALGWDDPPVRSV